MGTIPCSVYAWDASLVVSGSRSSRAAISDFLGCFFGRYFILSMFECHVRFERIFDKISEHVKTAKSVDIAVPELAVTVPCIELRGTSCDVGYGKTKDIIFINVVSFLRADEPKARFQKKNVSKD